MFKRPSRDYKTSSHNGKGPWLCRIMGGPSRDIFVLLITTVSPRWRFSRIVCSGLALLFRSADVINYRIDLWNRLRKGMPMLLQNWAVRLLVIGLLVQSKDWVVQMLFDLTDLNQHKKAPAFLYRREILCYKLKLSFSITTFSWINK